MHSTHKMGGVQLHGSLVCYSRTLATALNSSVLGTSKAQNRDLKTNTQSEGMGI